MAIVYYDREMGQSELMRGSTTGMFLHAPKSLVAVLRKMKAAGYAIDPLPSNEDELIHWMMDRGRQIGVWAPGVLDRLARSGAAVLVPVETYVEWFHARVPQACQQAVIERWGPPPGKFLVWQKDGRQFIVIPRIDLGHVILLPQPLRGEAQDPTLLHDRHVPPPHNYLATYFWLDTRLPRRRPGTLRHARLRVPSARQAGRAGRHGLAGHRDGPSAQHQSLDHRQPGRIVARQTPGLRRAHQPPHAAHRQCRAERRALESAQHDRQMGGAGRGRF